MMGSHNPESPFPKKLPDGRTVIDEICTCGCRRSHHWDSLAFGQGSCRQEDVPHCNCPKFTFKDFVFLGVT